MSQTLEVTRNPTRRWFQYSLRTLFCVVTVVALAMIWLARERAQSQRELAAAAELESQGFSIELGPRFCTADNPRWVPATGWRKLLGYLIGQRVYAARIHLDEKKVQLNEEWFALSKT